MESLPVVDFSVLSSDEVPNNTGAINELARQLIDAFTTVGFVYITNHGIPQSQVDDIHALGSELFSLPLEIKKKYPRKTNHGYVMMEQERNVCSLMSSVYDHWYGDDHHLNIAVILSYVDFVTCANKVCIVYSINPERPGDLKECFNVIPSNCGVMYPQEVDNCEKRMLEFYQTCWKLSQKVLLALAHGLGIPTSVFERSHTYQAPSNPTTLRFLHYPPLPESVKPNQIRLGEHPDYGTITLLFQDDIGGLEVLHQSGEWVPATPLSGAVLVNIADLLQRWSADKLKSTVHRVRIPAEELRRKSSRYSVAYFVHPDDEFSVECLDNSNKYPPVLAGDFLQQKLDASY